MTDIRITIETRDAKYSDRFVLQSNTDSVDDVVKQVNETLLEIVAPRVPGLTKQVETPGLVDAELSAAEYQLLLSYRTAVAQVGGESDLFSPVVSLLANPAVPATSRPEPDYSSGFRNDI